jgi:hypothetical protein
MLYSGAIAGEVTKYVQGLEGESKVYVMVGNGWIRVPLKRGSYSLCGALFLPLSTRTRSIRAAFYGTERCLMVRSDKLDAEGW